MDVSEVLLELYGRIPPLVARAVDGLDADALSETVRPNSNPIGWLAWHLARVQDSHIAEILERPQVWEEDGWPDRFGLDPDPRNSGYGHTPEQVAAVRPAGSEVLVEYLDAVNRRTRAFLQGLVPDDLDRIVDRSYDPPVTMGVRLVSVANDGLQHAGQANYLRGLLGR